MVAGMLMPLDQLRAIYEVVFRDGVMVAKNDERPQSRHAEVPGVTNLQVTKAMGSLKSRGFVRETFVWRHCYWYLTNEGIAYLRQYLHLPPEIVPASLQRVRRPAPMPGVLRRPPAPKVQTVSGPTCYVPKAQEEGDRQDYRKVEAPVSQKGPMPGLFTARAQDQDSQKGGWHRGSGDAQDAKWPPQASNVTWAQKGKQGQWGEESRKMTVREESRKMPVREESRKMPVREESRKMAAAPSPLEPVGADRLFGPGQELSKIQARAPSEVWRVPSPVSDSWKQEREEGRAERPEREELEKIVSPVLPCATPPVPPVTDWLQDTRPDPEPLANEMVTESQGTEKLGAGEQQSDPTITQTPLGQAQTGAEGSEGAVPDKLQGVVVLRKTCQTVSETTLVTHNSTLVERTQERTVRVQREETVNQTIVGVVSSEQGSTPDE
ncbi:hypothetical protein XELAEV_18032535mg, partial [Xenopus laevis]